MKPWIILVDHTTAAIHVVEHFQKNGWRVFYLGTNEALQKLADGFVGESPNSSMEIFLDRYARQLMSLNPVAVYSLLEHAKSSEARLAEALNCRSISAATLRLSRDKNLMREKMKAAGLTTVKTQFIPDGVSLPQADLPFPFIVKPNSGYASGGVQRVHNAEQFAGACGIVRRLNRFVLGKDAAIQTGVLCEEFIEGPEFSVDSITVAGRTRVFCVCGRSFVAEENYQDYLYYTSPVFPAGQSLSNLEAAVSRFLTAMEHTDGPSHTEVRFDLKRNQWIVLESGLRVGFAGNIGKLIEETSELPYNAMALKAHMKSLSPKEFAIASGQNKFGFVFTPATGKGGIIKAVRGLSWLESHPAIRFFNFQKQVGDAVVPYPKGLEYLGVIIGVSETREGQQALAQEVAERVEFVYEQ